MDDKPQLLDKLRIERESSQSMTGGRRWIVWLGIGFLFVVGTGSWMYVHERDHRPLHAAAATPPPIASGDSTNSSLLDASGYVVAIRKASVSAKSIYKVREVLVQEGQTVKKGQILASLDDSNALLALTQTRAQLRQLEATLDQANLAVEDARPLFERDQRQIAEGLISREAFDIRRASFDALQSAAAVAKRSVTVGRAALAVSQSYEDDTVIRAPFDGVITAKNAQPGQIVSPQFSGGGGIVDLVDMESLAVDVDVSENYIQRVREGIRATVILNAYPDWKIPARVMAIVPTANQSKATVKVRIALESKDARILPEMSARVSLLPDTPR